jgi:hypothetical protein
MAERARMSLRWVRKAAVSCYAERASLTPWWMKWKASPSLVLLSAWMNFS